MNSFRKLIKEYLEVKKESNITQKENNNYENKTKSEIKIKNNDSNFLFPRAVEFKEVLLLLI